eukprot:m.238178 g.238178  ORF g.238178 m.238178 type:complete len:387 (+) comp54350_c0_seq4:155-1315(+)
MLEFALALTLVPATLVVLLHIFSIFSISFRLRQDVFDHTADRPLTIIKPLLGMHHSLEENLRSFFELPLQSFELLFCVEREDDPCVPLVQRLQREFAHVRSRLYTSPRLVGINPKICNIIQAYEDADYDVIWICDSAIRTNAAAVWDMLGRLQSGIGVVHQLPLSIAHTSLGCQLESVYFSGAHARTYLSADLAGQPCVNGMSNMFLKSRLNAIGGLQAFASFLAEDHFISLRLFEAGFRPTLSSYPALQFSFSKSLTTYYQRQLRWSRLRQTMLLLPSIVEPFTEAFVGSLNMAMAARFLGATSSLLWLWSCACVGWLLLDYTLSALVLKSRRIPFLQFVQLWMLRESTAVPIYLHALCRPTLRWGAKGFQLRWGGKAEAAHLLT